MAELKVVDEIVMKRRIDGWWIVERGNLARDGQSHTVWATNPHKALSAALKR